MVPISFGLRHSLDFKQWPEDAIALDLTTGCQLPRLRYLADL